MTTHQLTAVQPLPERPVTFRQRAAAALETHQGMDLVSFLSMLHEQDVAELTEQAVSARNSVTQVAAAAAVDQQMLSGVLDVVRPMLRHSAENAARAAHFASLAEGVRALAAEADAAGEFIDTDQLRRVIDVAAAPAPWRPIVLGFVPSTQYRAGHFRHVTTNVEWHLPFSGYALCEESPERPMTTHVAFLHKGVVRPRPQLYAEFGLVMEHME
jgi:hypothetical protein